MTPLKLERRLRWAVGLVGFGLAGQAVTLLSGHPLAFMGFLLLAAPVTVLGVAVYLLALIRD